MEHRKADHIEMAFLSQVNEVEHDNRFFYEPLLQPHHPVESLSLTFLGKKLGVPMWVSSMTGGTFAARKINSNLARVCREFRLGMGLGSCRALLESNASLHDFDMREIIGDDLPLFANLGISQVEQLVENNQVDKIRILVDKLRADGLVVHVNPLQEFFQPGGDRLKQAPIVSIKRLLDEARIPVIVKEVGQGMGPASLRELIRLPLAAIEFAAFGGTNFSKLEMLRSEKGTVDEYGPLASVGESAGEMVSYVNKILADEPGINCREFIISGGIKSFLDGFYLMKRLKANSIFGQASGFLKHAKEGYEELHQYVSYQVNGLNLANTYLTVKKG
jgi:isopentenyl-diphosphate delta-isomerase